MEQTNHERIVLRTFMHGDETALVDLFNKCYEDFAGFVPRTIEYWTWCCLNRPDVTSQGITIATKNEKIMGYIVMGSSGSIWEICHYNDVPEEDQLVTTMLLEWALQYAIQVKCDSVVLNAPLADEIVRANCQKLQFVETPSDYVFISILDLTRLIEKIIQSKGKATHLKGIYWIKLRDCPDWCSNSFGVNFNDNQFFMESKQNRDPELVINTDLQTLFSCMLGTKNIAKAVLTSKIAFRPRRKFYNFMQFLSLIQINFPWFMPKADSG